MGDEQVASPTSEEDAIRTILSLLVYRDVSPTDIFQCVQLEKSSYPKGKGASKNDLQYRQHHAARFFRCAVLENDDEEIDEDEIVGYICSTRSDPLEDDAVSKSHQPGASALTIHSVVVKEEYRRQGLATDMLRHYVDTLRAANATDENPVSKLILYAKGELLTLFVQCGFSVLRPSDISVYGKDQRYLLELQLQPLQPDPKALLASGAECYIVDSFAAAPGTGNPAAVVLLPADFQADSMASWMQIVAAEFNLSETAFCWPRHPAEPSSSASEELHWNIRYFTPKIEVQLCGHATLASAAVLYQSLEHIRGCRIVFHAIEDDLTMELAESLSDENPESWSDENSMRTRISMEFPAKPPKELTTLDDTSAVRMMLKSAFSCDLEPLYVGISDIGDVLIELTPDEFHDIGYEKLNFKALMEWDGYYRGVIVCCSCPASKNGEKNDGHSGSPDFLSRFFGPKAGINEDPVTGTAHCVLGPYFSQKLKSEKVVGKQTSERGGIVECLVTGDNVRLTGTAVTTISGTLWL
jgi:predicted PhzF superfamily epimerase YddE/YHI9/ribosomal protein S18 acetylase RimI-like enzyme